MKKILVFDVESVGLQGEGFAVGWVLLDKAGTEIDSGYAACPSDAAAGTAADRKWIEKNIVPHLPQPMLATPRQVRDYFWNEVWMPLKNRDSVVSVFSDCGFPVETNFLSACVQDDLKARGWDAPYPMHEIGTVLLLADLDPTAHYDRLPNELPVHHPTADARQSARLLIQLWRQFETE